jgi:hypothetical protein
MSKYHRTGQISGSRDLKMEPTIENAAKYVAAETSLAISGPVSEKVFAERKAHCVACPSRVLSDNLPDEIGYCRSCGCGVSERARLTVKLTMPSVTCPLGKFGAAEGVRPGIISRTIDAAEKFLNNLTHLRNT